MTSVHLKQALAFIYLFVVQPLSEMTKITNASAQSHRLHVSAAEAFRDKDPGPTGLEESSTSPSNRLVLGLVESSTNQTQHQSVTTSPSTSLLLGLKKPSTSPSTRLELGYMAG